MVIPIIVQLVEAADTHVVVRAAAIRTLGCLCGRLDFSDYASRIIHPLARVLDQRMCNTSCMTIVGD
jgi:serine/threonine-protein kinase mTOR